MRTGSENTFEKCGGGEGGMTLLRGIGNAGCIAFKKYLW